MSTMKTNPAKKKIAYLSTRVTVMTREEFMVKASKFGPHTEILRELVEAFVDDRLTISPPTGNEKEKLYVSGK